MIDGVVIKKLITHSDERGYFREVVRANDEIFREGFGQWSHSLMFPGTIKAWHIHQKQIDWWYVPIGNLKAVLSDRRQNSETFGNIDVFLLGEFSPSILKIPPGVAHGCKVIGKKPPYLLGWFLTIVRRLLGCKYIDPVHLLYITSRIYDPDDEGRLPHDDPSIGYDWLARAEIK